MRALWRIYRGDYRAARGHEMTSTDCKPWCRHKCPECRMGLGSHLYCDPQCYGYDPDARYVPEPPLDDERPFFFAHRNAMSVLNGPYATIRYDRSQEGWITVVRTMRGTHKAWSPEWTGAIGYAESILRRLEGEHRTRMQKVHESASQRRAAREEELRGEHAKG